MDLLISSSPLPKSMFYFEPTTYEINAKDGGIPDPWQGANSSYTSHIYILYILTNWGWFTSHSRIYYYYYHSLSLNLIRSASASTITFIPSFKWSKSSEIPSTRGIPLMIAPTATMGSDLMFIIAIGAVPLFLS